MYNDQFSRTNQVRNRSNHQFQQNSENFSTNTGHSHDFRLIGSVTGINGHNAQTSMEGTMHRSCNIRNNNKSLLSIPNLQVKMNKLKSVSKSCVNNLRKKIHSMVQHNEGQSIPNVGITPRDVSDAMSSGSIKSHREFAMLTENLLAWGGGIYLSQFGSIKDFAELTPLSFYENQMINQHVAVKLVDYMSELPECKRFTVKYINWKLKFSKIPEEYILSVEYLDFCLKNLGAGFPSFITRSLMKTLGRLLKITTFKYSLARDVKKQISKILSGSPGHQGVATDPRIHVLKSKILFTIQLCHDAFIMQQALYPDFFIEYKRMRAKGIRFPRIPPGARYMIKDVEVISQGELRLPIDLKTLSEISEIVTRISNGEENEELRSKLVVSKGRVLESINILSEMTLQEFKDITFVREERLDYDVFMDMLIKLNDAIDELLSNNMYQELLQLESEEEEEEEEEEMDKDLAEIFSMQNDTYEPVEANPTNPDEYSTSVYDDAWSSTRNDYENNDYESSRNDYDTARDTTSWRSFNFRSEESSWRGYNPQGEGRLDDLSNHLVDDSDNFDDDQKSMGNGMNMEEIMRKLDQIHSEL